MIIDVYLVQHLVPGTYYVNFDLQKKKKRNLEWNMDTQINPVYAQVVWVNV